MAHERSRGSHDRSLSVRTFAGVTAFLRTESASAVVLFAVAVVALGWANSPVAESYERLWHAEVSVNLGGFRVAHDLRGWVDEGLMTLFFFVVGLEIKRELVAGELRGVRRATLPVIAAAGGMLVPALIYLLLNGEGGATRGWGIPMATDIAFAVGLLGLFGQRVPSSLKVFLLSIAIADDIGAILVIGLFYSAAIQLGGIALAVLFVVLLAVLGRLQVPGPLRLWTVVYLLLGVAAWFATLESGLHATLSGVALAFVIPVHPADRDSLPPAEHLEDLLHPWSGFFVLPLFALANAGVSLSGVSWEPGARGVTLGIALGLLVGKTIGISAFSLAAVKLRLGALPGGVGRLQLVAVAAVAGIGFTVSLFIAALAFPTGVLASNAKVGVLGGSLASALVGSALLLRAAPAGTDGDD